MTVLTRLTGLTGLRPATRAALLAMLLTTGLGGCASNPAAPVLLTLPSAPPREAEPSPPASPASPIASRPLLTLRRITLPEYLVSRRVRYRSDAATLAEWPNTYWAERIEIGVAREFVAALRQQLPGWTVCDTSCGEAAALLTLDVDVLVLDYLRATQTLRTRARISLHGTPPGQEPGDELAYELPAAADTAPAHAQAVATAIRALASAAALRVRAARP